MKLTSKIVSVLALSLIAIPVAAGSASASPGEELNDAYCDTLEALGYEHVQDCRFIYN